MCYQYFLLKYYPKLKEIFVTFDNYYKYINNEKIMKFEIHWSMEGYVKHMFKHTKLSNIRVWKDIVSPLIRHQTLYKVLPNICYIIIDPINIGIIWKRKDLDIFSHVFNQPFIYPKCRTFLSIDVGNWCPCFFPRLGDVLSRNKAVKKDDDQFRVCQNGIWIHNMNWIYLQLIRWSIQHNL